MVQFLAHPVYSHLVVIYVCIDVIKCIHAYLICLPEHAYICKKEAIKLMAANSKSVTSSLNFQHPGIAVGEIQTLYSMAFVGNFFISPAPKELRKSVDNGHSYSCY